MKQIKRFKKQEEKKIPAEIDYHKLKNLRKEAREKLAKIQPVSVGQASRISGVSPADISSLMVSIEEFERGGKANG